MGEHVQLDGHFATTPWPLDLAVSLLQDPAPWGYWWPGHPDNQRPNRYADFNRLALQVTAYTRHPLGSAWRNPLHDTDLSRTYASYSTQDLLDTLRTFRNHRMVYCAPPWYTGAIHQSKRTDAPVSKQLSLPQRPMTDNHDD
jgi:hypothetical protein